MRYRLFKIFLGVLGFLSIEIIEAQNLQEIIPPYNIKTISFMDNGQNVIPVFKLGEAFELNFDDLFGNEANYYYEIIHC
ncbi:type IX secretion system plug protein domain-containing protein, partial [Flavobacterium sp.]